MPTSPRRAVAAASTVIALVGCGPRDDGRPIPAPPTEVRHDLAPLTSRFPALGAPVSADWVTWNSSDPDDRGVPGPTTSWIDAVVQLEPSTAAALLADHQPADVGATPDVQPMLVGALPGGPYLSGPRLDAAFTAPGLVSEAFLNPAHDVLVLATTLD